MSELFSDPQKLILIAFAVGYVLGMITMKA